MRAPIAAALESEPGKGVVGVRGVEAGVLELEAGLAGESRLTRLATAWVP